MPLDFSIKHNIIILLQLLMVYDLHKFKHFLLGNKSVFYIDHMVIVYLVNKPHVLRRIATLLEILGFATIACN
jgi:hypothetical protein